jgi:peptidoglycan hydrolase CwlO-like protein
MIKKYLFQLLPSIIVLSIFFIFFYSPSNQMARKSIKELNVLNQSLKRANDSIILEIKSYEDDLNKSDEIIQSFMEEDGLLKKKLNSLNNKLTNLKSKYEEANSHSNNFDSSRIREYFSNIE